MLVIGDGVHPEAIEIKKFYVASSFKNIASVRHVCMQLVENGFVHTYDWTKNERASIIEDLIEIGYQEKKAVLDADFFVILLPAGKGSHIEFGLALGAGKKIYLYSPDNDINNFETTSTFYHLSNIEKYVGPIDGLIDTIITNELRATNDKLQG